MKIQFFLKNCLVKKSSNDKFLTTFGRGKILGSSFSSPSIDKAKLVGNLSKSRQNLVDPLSSDNFPTTCGQASDHPPF